QNYAATSDDGGNYVFVGASTGAFSVTAQDYNTGLTGLQSASIDVLADGARLDVPLQPSGVVAGTVRSAKGSPIVGVSVTVVSTGLNYQRVATTDDSGHYQVDDVALGQVTIRSFVSPFNLTGRGELTAIGQ